MLADYHVHSNFSKDSKATMLEQVDRAISLGFQEICFTEHLEYGFSQGDWTIDIPKYSSEIERFASKPIKVRRGCEAGIACGPEYHERLKQDVEGNFDFVLISLHGMYDRDPYREDIFAGSTPSRVFQDYVCELLERARYFEDNVFSFDAIAHIDYLSKAYGRKELADGHFKYKLASDEIDELFRYVIGLGKCIELNTSSWRLDGKNPPFDTDWLKRYSEVGGEYITIGSDAHSPEHVGYRTQEAMELAMECGIRYCATLKTGSPFYINCSWDQ